MHNSQFKWENPKISFRKLLPTTIAHVLHGAISKFASGLTVFNLEFAMFMSPNVGRKNGRNRPIRDDESLLILNSPNSDGDANSILNGNHLTSDVVGFAFPNVKLKTPVSQVS